MIPSAAGINPDDPAAHASTNPQRIAGDAPEKESSPSTPYDDDDQAMRFSSSSESSCASFDPFELDEHEIANSLSAVDGQEKPGTIPEDSSHKYDHDDVISPTPTPPSIFPEYADNHTGELSLGRISSGGSVGSSSSNESLTQSPPVQVMERTGDLDSDTPSPYRIPSSVFRRNPSSTPQEWSTTSNESLFSIQMGNMSFTKDMYFFFKSGELGKPGDPLMSPSTIDYSSNQPPPPLIDYSSKQTSPPPVVDYSHNQPLPPLVDHSVGTSISSKPAGNSRDIFKTNNNNFDQGLRANPEAIETMKSVLRENARVHSDKDHSLHADNSCHSYDASPSHRSSASGASTKSFAFPTFGGTGAKSGSSKVSPGSLRQHSRSVGKNLEQQNPKPETAQKPETNKASAPVDTGQTRWFSCFSCCYFC